MLTDFSHLDSCASLLTAVPESLLPPLQSALQPEPSLQNVDQIRLLPLSLFSFQPPDDPCETVRSWHASAQNPPTLAPNLMPSKMQSPASGPPSSTTPLYLLCVFPKHAPTVSPLHWLSPQPRIIFLWLPILLSLLCQPCLCSDVSLSVGTFQTSIFTIATLLYPAAV